VTSEYVNDVPYVRHFLADLSPARLRLTAALNGLSPPPGDELDYCELGCAHGDTLSALAAANPRGGFLGVDLSAEHVASAKKLARDGALDNVGFLERDFGSLLEEDIGELDYVVAHGVLSWISPEKRKALLALASAKLRPGGLLHVSYNALPGWSSVEPLRQLLLAARGPGGAVHDVNSLTRARRGVDFARAMRDGGAEYFARNPDAAEMLTTMERVGLPYVVHEYLHEHWTPMYFARVAWEMAEQDLHFVGVQPLHLNFREMAIPASLDAAFERAEDRLSFESLRDFALNTFFRSDVYVKGKVARSAEATHAYLDATPWATLTNEARDGDADAGGSRAPGEPARGFAVDEPIHRALLEALGEGASLLPDVASRPALAAHGLERAREALVRLVAVGKVIPMQTARPAGWRAAALSAERFEIRSPYNQMMLRRLAADLPLVMASIAAGTGFPISALDALALRIFTEVPAGDRERWIHDFVERQVLRLRVGDHVVEDRASQRPVIAEAVAGLQGDRLAKLVELGILSPAPPASSA